MLHSKRCQGESQPTGRSQTLPVPDTAYDPRRTYFGVQALRAVAALFVVGYHATLIPSEAGTPLAGGVWSHGACGVDIFFVISGFVMVITAPGLAGRTDRERVFLQG